MKRILTNETGSVSTPNHFSDSQDDQPDCQAAEPVPQTGDELREMFEQKLFDLEAHVEEFGESGNERKRDANENRRHLLMELCCEPVQTDEEIRNEEHNIAVHKMMMEFRNKKARKKSKKEKIERQGEGRECGTPCSSTPPIDNMGPTKYNSTPPSLTLNGVPPRHGGYDGGVEVGFSGYWGNNKFQSVTAQLDEGKKQAQAKTKDFEKPPVAELNGGAVVVLAHGAKSGVYYSHVFERHGVKYYIHNNPDESGKIQPIRVRYDAFGLQQHTLPVLHQKTKQFISDLGFTITEEKVSRADMQIIVPINMIEFYDHIKLGHAVTVVRNYSEYGKIGSPETYTLGSIDRIELCFYDKRIEVERGYYSVPRCLKSEDFVDNCCGQEWWYSDVPITRVEYRIGRDVLRELGIDTVDDLLQREKALVEYLTTTWFRLLKNKKHRGHENTQEVHEYWIIVQKLFQQWFTGHSELEDKEIEWNRKKKISCDPKPLISQGAGCFATALAISTDISSDSVHDPVAVACKFIDDTAQALKKKIAEKAIERQQDIETRTGVRIGKERIIVTKSNVDICGMDIDRMVIHADFFEESPRPAVLLE